MSEIKKMAAAAGALVTAADAAPKRADNDPLKNASSSDRDKWFKESPDRWKVAPTIDWGDDCTMASELATVIKDADSSQWPSLEGKLLEVLKTDGCTEAARGWVCRMLRLIGSVACLPALEPMLADAKTADQARYALEMIPGAEVDAALEKALGKLDGDAKTGLEGTIAARKQFNA